MNLQAIIDGMSEQWQRERAETQLTLGKMIAVLEAMPVGTMVANLHGAHSYRGYYCDLAFAKNEGTREASELLSECKSAVGRVFQGYKGGDFMMGASTPLWIASYGNCGQRLIALHVGGEIETADND